MGPDVTVVVPVHNGIKFLAQALESVAAQNLDLEVVVVDDGSTDSSGELARDLGHSGSAGAAGAGIGP